MARYEQLIMNGLMWSNYFQEMIFSKSWYFQIYLQKRKKLQTHHSCFLIDYSSLVRGQSYISSSHVWCHMDTKILTHPLPCVSIKLNFSLKIEKNICFSLIIVCVQEKSVISSCLLIVSFLGHLKCCTLHKLNPVTGTDVAFLERHFFITFLID